MTLPLAPLSLPATTTTVSPFFTFMASHHLRRPGVVGDAQPRLLLDHVLSPMSASSPDPRSLAEQLLGPFEDLHDPPPLGGGQRPGLHQQHPVADAALLLVVRLQLAGTAHDLAVQRVLDAVLDLDHDGLLHL